MARRYSVYVIELSDEAGERSNPDLPCVYVGQTVRSPEERFFQHKTGKKSSRWVKMYGVRLRPDLYEDHNPIKDRDTAELLEKTLAANLTDEGYTVFGGH
ncbi:hypothetical protein ACFL3H_08615 [Gemmatimonadota bacterium]